MDLPCFYRWHYSLFIDLTSLTPFAMFKSYFTIGWRNLLNSKTHAFINIGGLAVGIASCLLIGLYVADELHYDRHYDHADRMYRVVAEDWAKMPPAMAPELTASYPHVVERAVRLWPLFSPAKMRHKEVVFVESGVVFADPEVFSVFTWPFVAGDPARALIGKNSIVLTRSMATKYFGTKDPLGESMKFWGNDLTVTGVMEDVPRNSHLTFDFLVSISSLQMVMGDLFDTRWDLPVFYTYVLSKPGVGASQLAGAVEQLVKKHVADASAATLQPVASIHLHSKLRGELRPGGNVSYLYILGSAALFILLLAGVNFTNLSTARATTRAREVGMRQTLGAVRRQLIAQFVGESLITCVLAWVIANAIATAAVPAFNQFTGKSIPLHAVWSLPWLGGSLLVMALISFCAGSYPAFFLSGLRPIRALKGTGGTRVSNPFVRKGLIVFQFMISTFFLSAMVVVLLQLNYIQRKELGFDQEQVIVLDGDGFPILKKELQNVAGVQGVAGVPQVFPAPLPVSTFRAEGIVTDSTDRMTHYGVTPGFIETMGITLLAGKAFVEGSAKDEQEAFVLNESAVHELGWSAEEAIGKSFSMVVPPLNGGNEVWRNGFITGVVRDFHYDALYEKVSPLVLYPSYDMNLTFVRVQQPEAIAAIQQVWKKVNPDAPFEYYFLDDHLRQQYESEMKLGTLVTAATGLAVIIACLGLSGLVSFSANQRTKEIGIRKVMGASSRQVVALLSRDFMTLVSLAAVLSLPIAYYALRIWITNFAYHIELSWLIFAMAGVCTLSVALATVVLQSLRVALARPTESLRSE
jgi:putative ABC transport system permease protein